MDPVRDLGRTEPWQESLQRSRARRSSQPKPATRSPLLVRRAAVVLVLGLSVALPLSALAGGRSHGSPAPGRAVGISTALQTPRGSGGAGPLSRWPVSRVITAGLARACQPTDATGNYVNPLVTARVKPERIDQGVDYAGSGPLVALGGATVTYVATTETGWPGSFIEYRLLDGPDAGCYVYYAEGIEPRAGLQVGDRVEAGQPIARIIPGWPTGIELGWGAGTSTATYAAETHQWSTASDQDSMASAAGKSFSAMIAALGGPPGRVEG